MDQSTAWVEDLSLCLLTDLYELTMLQAYWQEDMHDEAVFSLFVRRLPERRNYLVSCGLADVLSYLETLHFTEESLEYLESLGNFSPGFLRWLEVLRFEGSVYAVPEGTPVFADEPLLEVVAPISQAQLVETYLMNQVHFQTVLASKAARVVSAASNRTVVDFGLRRMHGVDAGLKAARAFHISGVSATSNVLAGKVYGAPVTGTMAHSYIQAHEDERRAFRAFASLYPNSILLVDTYDTLEGVRRVVALADELGDEFKIRGIRLDSGDLSGLAFEARRILDEGGLEGVGIFASGGLDEDAVAEIVQKDAPIVGFGIGTSMGVARDEPSLDIAFKLTDYGDQGRLKLSPGKKIYPGRKQVFRLQRNGRPVKDILARHGEVIEGRPLLEKVMQGGKPLSTTASDLDAIREYTHQQLEKLPSQVRCLKPADPPYPVEVSRELLRYQQSVIESFS
jgi:nicotinate phosphoribosyltransferase